jgi:hypothetical protein
MSTDLSKEKRCTHRYEPVNPRMKHFPRGTFRERCVKCGKTREVEVV